MTKFFRQLRQRLLFEKPPAAYLPARQGRAGKTSRYLKYAVGEIFLVVLGILIALQINTWNEHRKARILENQFILNLQLDVDAQLKELDLQIDREVLFIETANSILNSFRADSKLEADSTFSLNLLQLTERRTFKVYNPTFTELLSSGQVSLLTDPKLKSTVVEYYQELTRFEKIVQNNNLHLTDQNFVPTTLKLGNFLEVSAPVQHSDSTYAELMASTTLYDSELAKISTHLINEPANLLLLINTLKMRHGSSASLLNWSLNMKNETLKLQSLLAQSHD